MPTFREILMEFDRRRAEALQFEDNDLHTVEWAIASILERLANWEAFRDSHPNVPANDPANQ